MKNKLKLFFLSNFYYLFFFSGTRVYGEEKKEVGKVQTFFKNIGDAFETAYIRSAELVVAFMEKLSEEFGFTVSLSSGLKHLDKITSKVWFGNDWIGINTETAYFINNMMQALFWIPKFIFRFFGELYSFLSNAEESIDFLITLSLEFSSTVFKTLIGSTSNPYSLGALIVGLIVLRSLVSFAYNGSFFKELLKGLLLFLTIFLVFTKVDNQYLVQKVYTNVTKVGDEVVSDYTNAFDSSSVSKEAEVARDLGDYYFRETIWKAYKFMNFDHYFEDGQFVFKRKNGEEITEEEMIDFLQYESGDDNFKVNGQLNIKVYVGSKDDVLNTMMKAAWGRKANYIVASFFDVIILGIVINLVGIGKIVLVVMLMLLLFLGVFSAILHLFYPRSGAFTEWAKRFVILALLSSFITLFGTLIIWLYDLLGVVFHSIGLVNPTVVAILKALVLFIIYKKRDLLIGAITGNGLRVATSSRMNRLISPTRQRQNAKKEENALRKLSIAKQLVKPIVGGALLSTGLAKIAGNRLKRTSVARSVGNKIRKSKTLDRISKISDGVEKTGSRISGFKDRVLSKYYDVKSVGYFNKNLKNKYRQKAKDLRRSARVKSEFEPMWFENRKKRRREQMPGTRDYKEMYGSKPRKILNLKEYKKRTKDSKELALKNRERLQKHFEKRARIRKTIEQRSSNDLTKSRLLKERSKRSSKPNINRNKFYSEQRKVVRRLSK